LLLAVSGTMDMALTSTRNRMPTTAEDLAIVHRALEEDAPNGDLTSELVVPPTFRCTAELIAKAAGILAGTGVAAGVVAHAALRREESRGGHYRSDFPGSRETWRFRQAVDKGGWRVVASSVRAR